MAKHEPRAGSIVAGLLLVAAGLAGCGDSGGRERATEARARSTAAVAAMPQADCSFPPLLRAAGAEDGKVALRKNLSGQSEGAVSSLILDGKEAAAGARPRDAELSFLMACRVAQGMAQPDPALTADAMYQLARHYASAAQLGAAQRSELFDRAATLYAASLPVYRARHGDNHEKTRFAEEGLATAQAAGGRPRTAVASAAPATNVEKAPAPPVVAAAPPPAEPAPEVAPPAPPPPAVQPKREAAAPAPAPAAAPAATPARKPDTQVAAAPVPPQTEKPLRRPAPPVAQSAELPPSRPPAAASEGPVARPQARSTRPSFDCRQARSAAEKIICQDEDLAQRDRELARLHARAKSASPDPRAFQRRSDEAWMRRESECTDAECVRQWYGERMAQLERQQPGAAVRPQPPVRQRAPARADAASPGVDPVPEQVGPPAEASGSPTGLAEPE